MKLPLVRGLTSRTRGLQSTFFRVETAGAVDSSDQGRPCDDNTGLAWVLAPRGQLEGFGDSPSIAIALSGGGFRATLAGLGVLRFVADAGLMSKLRWLSGVSGGSIAAAAFAARYQQLQAARFSLDVLDEQVITPVVQAISARSLALFLSARVWKTLSPLTRSDLLADALDQWFLNGAKIRDLSTDCYFSFNATNLVTGKRFIFSNTVVGDAVTGHILTTDCDVRLAEAAAASAAVPGVFPAMRLRRVTFPCASGNDVRLVDGGVWDNLGVDSLPNKGRYLRVVMNAGGLFRGGGLGVVPVIRDLVRSSAILYQSSVTARVEYTHTNPLQQRVILNLGSTAPAWNFWQDARPPDANPRELAALPTSFARFSPDLCRRLVYQGWWLAGAALAPLTTVDSYLSFSLPIWKEWTL